MKLLIKIAKDNDQDSRDSNRVILECVRHTDPLRTEHSCIFVGGFLLSACLFVNEIYFEMSS